MKWTHDVEPNHYSGYRHVWTADFGGHRFKIYRNGSLDYKLWCHDVCSSRHWFVWTAKRQAIKDAIEHALFRVEQLDEFIGEVRDDLEARHANQD